MMTQANKCFAFCPSSLSCPGCSLSCLVFMLVIRFVWDDYTWSEGPEPYSQWGDNWIPSRIPLSALIDGPMVGQPFLPGDDTPRAVTKSYFQEVCAGLGGVQYLDTNQMNHDMWWDEQLSVLDVLNVWVEKLNSMDAACVSTGGSMNVLWECWCV